MRDPTRGGVATVLNELASRIPLGIEIDESRVPVNNNVKALCEMLGFDPLYIANEGKVIMVLDRNDSSTVLDVMTKNQPGRFSCVIGKIVTDHPGRVIMKTMTGGKRIIDSLTSDQLPRIC